MQPTGVQTSDSGTSEATGDDIIASASERASLARITTAIRQATRDLRQRHPLLQRQDAIGMGLFLACSSAIALTAVAYVSQRAPAWMCVISIGVLSSIIHEIEHDLIHHLYFKRHRAVHNILLALGWLVRPNTINPWVRRGMHLNHHRVSGTPEDIEERAITNGEPFGVKRLLMMADGLLAVLLRLGEARGRRLKLLGRVFAAYFPLGLIHFGIWYAFLGVQLATLLGVDVPNDPGSPFRILHQLTIVWILPNVIRSFCLNFISSSMHYYGDIERGNVLHQTQVLNAWFFAPLQLFCCNFGATHAIHHFIAGEPFYVRQWTARVAHRAMRDNGIRFNDLGTFRRANRYEQIDRSRPAQTARVLGMATLNDRSMDT